MSIRYIAKIKEDGTITHVFRREQDRALRGWLKEIPSTIFAVPEALRPFVAAVRQLVTRTT